MIENTVSLSGKETHKYDDIIQMEYPLKTSDSIKHPKMTIEDRAKIFAPFAALRGYEEAIAAKQKIVVSRVELSEESKEYLDIQLGKLERLLSMGEHPMITVVYFQKTDIGKRSCSADETEEESGEYIQFTGVAAKYHPTSRMLQIVDKKLKLEDIYAIEGEELEHV